MAGSSERYNAWNMTSPSFRSAFVGAVLLLMVNVSPGTIVFLGRLARTIERYMVEEWFDIFAKLFC
jgi:hypothetical protein